MILSSIYNDYELRLSYDKNLSFADFYQEKTGNPIERLMVELKVNQYVSTLQGLYTMSEDHKIFAKEMIREAIYQGINFQNKIDRLVAVITPASPGVVKRPYIDFSGLRGLDETETTPGQTAPMDKLSARSKLVGSKEYFRGIEVPFEFSEVGDLPLNTAATWFQGYGMKVQSEIVKKLVDVHINGDNGKDKITEEPVDESAMVIGVTNINLGIQECDYIRACVLMAVAGIPLDTMLCAGDVAEKALTWNSFLPRRSGTPGTTLNINIPLPTELSMEPTLYMEENTMCLANRLMGIEHFITKNLTVDTQRLLSKRLDEAFVFLEVGFVIMQRKFRIVVDGSLEFNKSQVLPWIYR